MITSIVQGGLNMTGTNCDLFTHNQSRSYLNHLVCGRAVAQALVPSRSSPRHGFIPRPVHVGFVVGKVKVVQVVFPPSISVSH
jgi:hypothetical protein